MLMFSINPYTGLLYNNKIKKITILALVVFKCVQMNEHERKLVAYLINSIMLDRIILSLIIDFVF